MGDLAPRRLSKPRTIKSSSNLLSEQPITPSSPYNSADQDHFARDAVVVNSHGERRSRSKSRSRIRAYLHGSSHDTIQTSSDDEEAQTGIAGAARDVRNRLSRTGSSITPLQSAKASAICLSNSTDSEESAMIADQIKQRAYHDSLAAQNHVSTPVDEDRHVDSVMAPLRRKSLYMPGIATRNASDILRKPPNPSTYHDYYYDHTRPETSPLSYLAALSMGEDGRSTPSDLHYPQLGSIQLGTLRVTNEIFSPLLGDHHPQDLAYRSPTSDSKTHDEYYTASEGTVNEGGLPTPRSGSPLKFESKFEASSPRTYFHLEQTPREPARLERELSDESFPFERQTPDKLVHYEGEDVEVSFPFTVEIPTEFERFGGETSDESIRFEGQTRNQSHPSKTETSDRSFTFEMGKPREMDSCGGHGESSTESFPSPGNLSKTCPLDRETLSQSSRFERETPDEICYSESETNHGSFPSKKISARTCPIEKGSLDVTSAIERETSQGLIHQKREKPDTSFSFERNASNESGRRMPTTSFSSEGRTLAEPFRSDGTPPDGASNIADEYIAELGGSPFLHSKAPIAKHGIGNDSLGDKEVVLPRPEIPEAQTWRSFIDDAEARHAGEGSREDAFRKLTGRSSMPSVQETQRVSIPFSLPASRHSASMRGSIDGEKSHESHFQHPQRPPDSGYSSNISLSASHETSFINDTEEAKSPDLMNEHQQRISHRFSEPREMSQYTPTKADNMSHPVALESAPKSSNVIPPSAQHHSRRTNTCKFSFERANHPVPVHTSQASPLPQAGETVRSSQSSLQNPTRKLQKQRPKSQPPPVNVITGDHELTDANIPRVPSIIAARHAGRLRQFPLLEHTFPSSQHTTADRNSSPVPVYNVPIRFPSPANALEAAAAPSRSPPTAPSKHRASTIVVDKDEWAASDLVRSPSWSEFGGGRSKTKQKKQAKEEKGIDKRLLKEEKDLERRLQKDRKDLERQIKKDENKQRSTRSRSASRTRARSSEGQSRHDTLVKIADFGTVTESLGNSPYDIATSMFPNPQNASNWHPHQISTAMPRPKSLFGAINRSQTMLLDMPSVPAFAAVDLKVHNLEWARDRQKSQSFPAAGAESFINRGGIPGKVVRPHSVVMEDTPPVPALPSAKQVTQREAAIIRSRPHSMVVEAPMPIPSSPESEQRKAAAYPSEQTISATRRKTKGSKMVPDLWSNGSLEKKSPNRAERSRQASNDFTHESDEALPANYSLWETQSHAWSQRRKSAGEALLRNQARDVFDDQEAMNSAPVDDHGDRPASPARTCFPGAFQSFTPTPSHLGPFPNPLASHPHLTAQQPTSTSNTIPLLHQSATQLTQRPGFSSLTSSPRPRESSFQLENQTPTSTLRRARTQDFQIPRKRVGSGPPILRTETAIGSSHYEASLI